MLLPNTHVTAVNTSSREVASLLDILDEAIKTGNLSEESELNIPG